MFVTCEKLRKFREITRCVWYATARWRTTHRRSPGARTLAKLGIFFVPRTGLWEKITCAHSRSSQPCDHPVGRWCWAGLIEPPIVLPAPRGRCVSGTMTDSPRIILAELIVSLVQQVFQVLVNPCALVRFDVSDPFMNSVSNPAPSRHF